MPAHATALQRLALLLTRALPHTVRANAARPSPPAHLLVHAIADLRVILPLEGRKEEVFGDGTEITRWEMRPGDCLVIRPDTWLSPRFHLRHRHLGIIVARDRVRVTWSRCDGVLGARQPLVQEAALEVVMPEHGPLRQAIDALTVVDMTDEQQAARHLIASLIHLLHATAARPQEPATKGERTWRHAFAYIQDNCHLSISRDEAAQALHMSPNYLSRMCKERSGRAFIDLITELRLERASGMLRRVDLPVAAVARACGFSDAGYFIRRFRRGFGVTPGAYRQTSRQGRVAAAPTQARLR